MAKEELLYLSEMLGPRGTVFDNETGLDIELHLESMVKIESLRTMASRNAGSKVPSQVKNSLYV